MLVCSHGEVSGSGSAQFSNILEENRELFMNGPYEFRVVESSHPDPLQYLSTFWERRLTEYVHEDHRAVDRQGLSENEIVTPSNYNALIIGAVVIASICGAVYFLKR